MTIRQAAYGSFFTWRSTAAGAAGKQIRLVIGQRVRLQQAAVLTII
jgi:hypothetical protein